MIVMSTCDWSINYEDNVFTKTVRSGENTMKELEILKILQPSNIPLFAKLLRHEENDHVYDNHEIENGLSISIFQEFAGETLSDWLKKKEPVVKFKSIIGHICIAVDYLTKLNIVHNDLNVSNVCIKKLNKMNGCINYNDKHFIEVFNEIPVLIDFGYSFICDEGTNGTHDVHKLVSNMLKYEKGKKVYRNYLTNLEDCHYHPKTILNEFYSEHKHSSATWMY